MPDDNTLSFQSVMVTDSPSTSRGFLTRIRSKTSSLSLPGLRSPRRRVLTDFHIQLDDPHRVYSPTDIVQGRVCIKVERPLNITHLVVNLVGRVDLQPSLSFGKEIPANSKEWDDDYDDGLSGAITLCRDRMVLCGEGRLEPGVYQFGFQLEFVPVGKLASSLPSSLDVSLSRPVDVPAPTRKKRKKRANKNQKQCARKQTCELEN